MKGAAKDLTSGFSPDVPPLLSCEFAFRCWPQ
jgi:hypothetical protein